MIKAEAEQAAVREAALLARRFHARPVDAPHTFAKPDGTVSDASRQCGENAEIPANTPPDNAKIALKDQQGVTGDAKSASPVDLAARSVPSPAGESGAATASPVAADKAANKKKAKPGITIRLNEEDRRRLEQMAGGGKSLAAVMLEAFRNSAQGTVPEANHQLRADLSKLLATLDYLIEHYPDNPRVFRLWPVLLAIKEKIFDLREDLLRPKAPDATSRKIAALESNISTIKKDVQTVIAIIEKKPI